MFNASSLIHHIAFLRYKPLVALGVIQGYFRKIILRQNVLRTVDLAVTGDCHYKCTFCSAYRLYKKGGPYLSVEQIKRLWQEAVKLGVIHVNLTGGEPFSRDINELCRIIRNFKPSRFLVSLVSNGLYITKDKLKQLKDVGLDTLQLSIESIDPQVNDSLIGIPGNLDKVLEAMRYAKDLKLNVCLNAVFYSTNAEEIRKLIKFAEKEKVFLVLNTASAEGKWKSAAEKRLSKRDADTFDEFMRYPCVRHDTSVNFSGRRECPGGKERIHITAYGDVLTCPLVQISYGNVLKEPLRQIYKRIIRMEHIKEYSRLCKHAFSEKYYEDIVLPISSEEQRPVSIFEHPIQRRMKNE